MFDFRRITLFCLEKRLPKHKMSIFYKNSGGGHGSFGPPGYAYGWARQIHNQYFQSQALVSPWGHFSIHCIILRSPRRSSKPPPMLLIWRTICFCPARPENTKENQPVTNLKPRTFANTTVTSKKVKDFTRRLPFCSNLYDASGII